MRAYSFIVAAIVAAKVSAEDSNEAEDNAFLLQMGYGGYGGPAYGLPQSIGGLGGYGGYVVAEPQLGYMAPQPQIIGGPYGMPAYEEPRARLIEVPTYGPQVQPQVIVQGPTPLGSPVVPTPAQMTTYMHTPIPQTTVTTTVEPTGVHQPHYV